MLCRRAKLGGNRYGKPAIAQKKGQKLKLRIWPELIEKFYIWE